MTPGLQLPESVRNAIESESTLNLTRRRKKRQIENGIPINNVSSVMFFFNIRLDNVRTEENVNIPVDIFVNPNIFPFPERIVHQPFWPISDEQFEIKVSCFLFLELFLRKRFFFQIGHFRITRISKKVTIHIPATSKPPKYGTSPKYKKGSCMFLP